MSIDFNCSRLTLPNAIILGPQKTGSTALHTFLKLHPKVQSNVENAESFEELQFFGGKNYHNGLDWYLRQFPQESGEERQRQLLFEKSATYFDAVDAPKQMHALIPEAKLIIILIDPAQRAYSWYQHMVAHEDPIALKYSFEEMLAATDSEDADRKLWKLRQRCVAPGRYAHYLDRWIEYYSPNRLLIVDGEQLKLDPAVVMDEVQTFLGLTATDYRKMLRFNDQKGFYCAQTNDKTKCLGRSKGRKYAPMNETARADMAKLYLSDNIALHKMITKMGWRTPKWLQEQLQKSSS